MNQSAERVKIFITGGTGFIGTHVVRRLAQTDHKLYCLVRGTSNITELKKSGVTLVRGDVTDKDSLLRGMKSCDWVVNLANVYSMWEPNRDIYFQVNVRGTQNVMECVLETGASKVVHVSTLQVYGKPTDCPFTEKSEVGPVRFSEYAQSKYEGDLIAWKLYKGKALPLVVLYPGGVLGSGDTKATGQYLNNLIRCRFPATFFHDVRFNYVYIGDVAHAIYEALEKQNNIGEKYFLGKHRLSFLEFNRITSEISGAPLPKLQVPRSLVMFSAKLATMWANLIKKPPYLGMSVDQIRMAREGIIADATKVERELGLSYTPIRVAIEEAIASYNG